MNGAVLDQGDRIGGPVLQDRLDDLCRLGAVGGCCPEERPAVLQRILHQDAGAHGDGDRGNVGVLQLRQRPFQRFAAEKADRNLHLGIDKRIGDRSTAIVLASLVDGDEGISRLLDLEAGAGGNLGA